MNNYTLGEYGLVIPFGVMFEDGDFEEYRGSTLLVNTRTVVRNAINAYDMTVGSERELISTLPEMLDVTCTMLEMAFKERYEITVKYYYCDHSDVKYGPLAFPINETPKRKLLANWTKVGVDHLKVGKNIIQVKGSITGPTDDIPESCAMITHYAQDLLHHGRFKSLVLFESHTGDIRDKNAFNRKLVLNKEQRLVIPFNRFTQHVFGDGTLYGPAPLDVRKTITDIAQTTGWSKTTPVNRLRFLMQRKNPALANFFNKLLT